MESNYWKYTHLYPRFVENAPKSVHGYITRQNCRASGVRIRPDIFQDGGAIVETMAKV